MLQIFAHSSLFHLLSQLIHYSLLQDMFNRSWRKAAQIAFIFLILPSMYAIGQMRTIEDYIGAARTYNASLIDYRNQLAALGFDSAKIANSYLPKINFTSQVMLAPV